MNVEAREVFLFGVLGLAFLVFLPQIISPYLGIVFGTYTTYVVTTMVLCLTYYVFVKLKKKGQ